MFRNRNFRTFINNAVRAGFKGIVMRTLCFVLFSLVASISHGQVITSIAGNGTSGIAGEGGPATNAGFSFLAGVTTDKWGNIYVASVYNSVIQKIDTIGILSRFAGNGFSGYSGDGSPATAASLDLNLTVGLAIDVVGDVYIACGGTVRKVNNSGIISTVAGNNIYGYSGDGGPATAAQFASITGICFDKAGNLYIADDQNYNIRMVNAAGIISTFVGTGTPGFSGDGGPASAAQIKTPDGIACDDTGNLYIADGINGRIRKVNTYGIITSVAGGNPDAMGPCCYWGCPATSLNLSPAGVAIDHEGNIYVADIVDDVVQKITPDGLAYAIAGNCTTGYSGDGGPATAAQLHSPTMICLDKRGNLLIADKGNRRIRKVWLDGTVHTPPAPTRPLAPALLIAPNPVTQKNISCTVQSDTNESASLLITDVLGRVVTTASCTTNTAANISLPLPSGMYFISATTASGLKMSAKIVVQ